MKDAMTQTAAATAFTTEQPPLSAPEPEQGNSDNGGDNSGQVQDDIRQIIETGSITVDKNGHYIHCLTIIGQIEGHYILPPQNKTTKYEHVIPQLVAIEESKEIEGLLIILNTVGGDIEAGLAIAELIAGMKKPTVSLVLGGGHSIGVPLAVSAKQSFIVPSATMTIHPVRMNGLVIGVPQTLSYFDKMQERIVRFVCENSNITSEEFRRLMMETGELMLGDIVISVDKVEEQAEKYGHSQTRELAFLVAHSMLHLCGYDHMVDEERLVMEDRQRQILDTRGYTR